MKYLILIILFFFISCGNDGDIAGDCPTSIKLSKEHVVFSAGGGTDNVIMRDTFWWIEGGVYDCGEIFGNWNNSDYCEYNYCNGDNIMKIECSWFSVTKTDEHTLVILVNKNETGEERKQFIGLQAGNCFSGFSITQSAE